MIWELRKVDDVDCQLDDSGVHVVINRVVEHRVDGDYAADFVKVRADLMSAEGEPIASFIGSANAVRKHLIRFMEEYPSKTANRRKISTEHASYIGYELLRAELTERFIQD